LFVETPGLVNIKPPRPAYRPILPIELIASGKISEIQLERIIYAGQSHVSRLPFANARAGISIGDGTSVGKTGTLLGIILDNWFSERKRAVWFSVKSDLIKAVKDEMTRLGLQIADTTHRRLQTGRRNYDVKRHRFLHLSILDCEIEKRTSPD